MKKIKKSIIVLLFVGIYVLSACSNSDVSEEIEKIEMVVPTGQDQTEQSLEKQTQSGNVNEGAADNEKNSQSDADLDEVLAKYREERESMIKNKNGLVEGGSPNEEKYGLDLSGLEYTAGFDTMETTEAYMTARLYVTDTLGIKGITKMEVYMCVDPRILAIYSDEDKGVAEGYENENIFLCEYSDDNGIWQYLILIREGKGEAWQVIHHGNSYKE